MQLTRKRDRSSSSSGVSDPAAPGTLDELVELIAAEDNDVNGAEWQAWTGRTGKLVRGVRVTATELRLPEDLDYRDWEEIGGVLQALAVSKERKIKLAARELEITNWWIADWVNFGDRRYGETYAQAVELTRLVGPALSEQTLANIASIGRQFPPERRRQSPAVTWSHHAEVAYLPAKQADELLDRAEEEGLTTRDLRHEATRLKDHNNGDDPDEAAAVRALKAAAERLCDKVDPSLWAPLVCKHVVFGIGYNDPPDDDWLAFLLDMASLCADMAEEHCGAAPDSAVEAKLAAWRRERAGDELRKNRIKESLRDGGKP